MQVKLNRKQLHDKIHACWLGKNIGGTMGAPYEHCREVLDIQGYSSPKGEPLPNDDLDLQLVWLSAMEHVGPHALTANVLSDYWVSYISPHWNEYGIAKSNLKIGLLPPLSGEFRNEDWKHSNGAWIRSEIWACLAPGFPNIAVKYAYMDAGIDHGIGEGTYGEIFTAALESMAFVETDFRSIIEKGLTYIPEDCRVARAVKLVLSEYDKKTSWREVREMIVADSADLGWFQAPANIAFTILGLVYGEGDFKKSLIYAINCGDDTDCTGATCGAILGILGGTAGISEDWAEYIGDRIITVAIDGSYKTVPKTCTELTDRVMELIPSVLKAHGNFYGAEEGIYMEYTDGAAVYNRETAYVVQKTNMGNQFCEFSTDTLKEIVGYGPYYFEINGVNMSCVVQYETEPVVKPLTDFKVRVYLRNHRMQPQNVEFTVALPEGWTAEYHHMEHLGHTFKKNHARATWEMTIHVGERTNAVNKVSVWATSLGRPVPIMIPVVLLG